MKRRTKGLLAALVAFLTGGLVAYKWLHHEAPKYDLKNVGHCNRCITLLKIRAMLTFIEHLIDDHGCSEEQAIDTMVACSERILLKGPHA